MPGGSSNCSLSKPHRRPVEEDLNGNDPRFRLCGKRLLLSMMRPAMFMGIRLISDRGKALDNGIDRSPLHLLHRASQVVDDVFTTGMQTNGLTPRQLAVLMTVLEHEGLSQTDLVDLTGIDRSTMADVVKRLKRRCLLQRRRTRQDARAYAVTLTDEGRRVLRTAEPLAKRVDRRVLDALPGKRQEEFMTALASIVSALERVGAGKVA
jgi:MarR family transcriptional regulator, temperature-dependent positive regulator of motility